MSSNIIRQTEVIYMWDKVGLDSVPVPAVFYGEQKDIDKIVLATFSDEHEMLWWERVLYLGRVRYRYILTITDE